jgi:hypothetical protein
MYEANFGYDCFAPGASIGEIGDNAAHRPGATIFFLSGKVIATVFNPT